MSNDGVLYGLGLARSPVAGGDEVVEIAVEILEIHSHLCVQIFFELMALMAVVHPLYGLLKADRDEQADADGGDVDEEVGPGVSGLVWRVDVDHRRVLLRILPALRRLDWIGWRLCMRRRRGRQFFRSGRGV